MEIGDSIRRKNKQDVVIKSVVWNTIIELFKLEKNIDVKDYLGSIKLSGNAIIIKTSKPIINTELLNLDDKIKSISKEKFDKIGIKFNNFDIRYL